MGKWSQSFLAALQKNALLRKKAFLATPLEILMPSLFMLLLSIGFWLSSNDVGPAQTYTNDLLNISYVVYDSGLFCTYNKQYSPPALTECFWNTQGSTYFNIGLNWWYYALTPNATIAAAVIAGLEELGSNFVIPDLDAYLILQGFVSTIFSAGNPLEKGAQASFAHPGYLGLVVNDDALYNAFYNFCTNRSYYCENALMGNMDYVFHSTEDARTYAYENGNTFWAILDFSGLTLDDIANRRLETLPYTISMNYTATPWTFQKVMPLTNGLGRKEFMLYLASGFLSLQLFVNEFLSETATGSPVAGMPSLASNYLASAPMPTKAYFTSQFLVQSGEFIPLVMTFAFLYGLSRALSGIVEEKEGKVREAMLIMGLPQSAFYCSWLVTSIVINAVACLGSTIVLSITLFSAVNPFIMWLVTFCFSLTIMAVSFLLSVFFSKPRIAAIFGPLMMFVSTIPYYAIPVGTPQKYIFAASVLPCTAYAQAINTFVSYCQNGYGITFGNIFDGDFSVALSIFIMLVDTVLYLAIALYLDMVLPSEHGTNRHPLFFVFELKQCIQSLSRRFTKGDALDGEARKLLPGGTDSNPANDASDVGVPVDELHERFSPKTDRIVAIRDLVKTYDGGSIGAEPIRAVRGISMNLHQGHIHVLLGHNGAGKSTTINMLVGLVPPTSGSISICDHDMANSLSTIRKNLGYCPQHNIIWPTLTVEQHLRVYARMKSDQWNVEDLVESTLDLVQLHEKRQCEAGSLSGGQKRKLCVGIALIGGSPFLLLDEPTAGMDLEARRSMWDMLLKIRRSRCVLLSTHFMDEADLLGDRIIIMSKGSIHSAGTPLYLKTRLGIGYSVICVLESEHCADALVEYVERNYKRVCALSQPDSRDATVKLETTKRGKEVIFQFPMSFTSIAGSVFEALESQQSALRVTSFGLSLTTMEDVFMNIAHLGEEENKKVKKAAEDDALGQNTEKLKSTQLRSFDGNVPRDSNAVDIDDEKAIAHAGFFRQFHAMFLKRFHCAKRDRRMLCFQVIMPIFFLSIALLILLLSPPDQPSLLLDGKMYDGSVPTQVVVAPDPTRISPEAIEAVVSTSGSPLQGVYDFNTISAECPFTSNSSECLSQYLASTFNTHLKERYVALSVYSQNQGVLFTGPATTVLHNATAVHSLPEAVSLLYNIAIQNMNLPFGKTPVIQTFNYPLTLSKAQQTLISSIRRIVSAIFILIPFTFIPANYVCYIVKEKECKAKHLQWVAGCNMFAFWLSSLVWDLITFVLTELLCIAVFFAFKRDEFIGTAETFAATFTLFFLYGLSSIPFSYVVSFAFKNSSAAQNITMMGNFFAGFLLVMAAQILAAIPKTQEINRWLCKFYRAVPAYALGEGIITLTGRELAMYVTGNAGNDPFDFLDTQSENGGFFGGVGTSLVYLGAAGPFFFIMLLVLEGANAIKIKLSVRSVKEEPEQDQLEDYGPEDEDVRLERAEAERVDGEERGRRGDGIVVQHLRKQYDGSKGKVAVKHLSFGVKTGETFALLGTNGAGKTTTISVLTGEHIPSCGDAYINKKSIVREMNEARQWIGYCPQFDALHEHMTPREHLHLYCRLRGLRGDEVTRETERTIEALDLEAYADTMSMSLSGGNKRKLSLGIALIGDTKSILLDEPTAGMDPVARRGLWKSLALVAQGRSIVLTTHHLEEVEALADRVGIMVGGKMMCLGTLQQLKSKFVGNKFEIHLSLSASQSTAPRNSSHHGITEGGGHALNRESSTFNNNTPATVATVGTRSSTAQRQSMTRFLAEAISAEAKDAEKANHLMHLTATSTVEEIQDAMRTVDLLRVALADVMRLRQGEAAAAADDDAESAAEVELVELNGNKITISVEGAPLSKLFKAIEAQKSAIEATANTNSAHRAITEYSISQATLEQVFLRIGLLARQEEEEEQAAHDAGNANGRSTH